jgi:hypothetical protein
MTSLLVCIGMQISADDVILTAVERCLCSVRLDRMLTSLSSARLALY